MFLKILLFAGIGIAGGIIGGMGMGGGTLLIPLLTMVAGLEQHVAQAINLCAFLPMSAAALIVHVKNGLVEGKRVPITAIPAVVASVGASLLSRAVDGKALSVYFGIFLGAVGIYQLVTAIVAAATGKSGENEENADEDDGNESDGKSETDGAKNGE